MDYRIPPLPEYKSDILPPPLAMPSVSEYLPIREIPRHETNSPSPSPTPTPQQCNPVRDSHTRTESDESILAEAMQFGEFTEAKLGLNEDSRNSRLKFNSSHSLILESNISADSIVPKPHHHKSGLSKRRIRMANLHKPLPPSPHPRPVNKFVYKFHDSSPSSKPRGTDGSTGSPEADIYGCVHQRHYQFKDQLKNKDGLKQQNSQEIHPEYMNDHLAWEAQVLKTIIKERENEVKLLQIRLKVIEQMRQNKETTEIGYH